MPDIVALPDGYWAAPLSESPDDSDEISRTCFCRAANAACTDGSEPDGSHSGRGLFDYAALWPAGLHHGTSSMGIRKLRLPALADFSRFG